MRITTLCALFLSALLLCASCKWNAVKVSKFEPGDEVPVKSSIILKFNKPLCPPEKQDKWLDDEFVKFKPGIHGKFKWVSPDELLFSPDGPLQPSQDYEAEVTDKVLFGEKMSTSFDDINFHTPFFKVQKVDFYWTQIPKSNYKVSVQANINFDYPVQPSELAKYIEVKKDGRPIQNYTIVTAEPSKVISVNFGEAQQVNNAQHYTIRVK
jgi:hypothetical protein